MALPQHPAAAWARALDLPAGEPAPVRPPRAAPAGRAAPAPAQRHRDRDLAARPLRDPRPPHPEAARAEAAGRGDRRRRLRLLVHDGLHRFLRGARRRLAARCRDGHCARRWPQALGEAGLRPALHRLVGAPAGPHRRLGRGDGNRAPRRAGAPVAIATEAKGASSSPRPGGRFRLTGRADRIERYGDGDAGDPRLQDRHAAAQKAVDAGLAPQLLLEAAMAADGRVRAGPDRAGDAN